LSARGPLSVIDDRLQQVMLTSDFPSHVDSSDKLLNMTTTATFSALLRTPNEVIERLEQGDVLLTRRDGEPLRLSKARSAQAESDTLSALAQLIAASLDDEACERLVDRLADPFPWIALLPSKFRKEFIVEFLGTARACASIGRFDRLTIALNAWQSTAEAYANPHLTSDGSELEPLRRPAAVANPRTAE
jgi:hypothetical protein